MSQPFSMIPLPAERSTDKPRTTGLTMMMDWGLPLEQQASWLNLASRYIDLAKIVVGTARLYEEDYLRDKLALYQQNGVLPFIGGQFMEYVFQTQGMAGVAPFCAEAKRLGFGAIEVSDNVVSIDEDEFSAMIRTGVDAGLEVHAEVGSKSEDSGSQLLIAQAESRADVVLVEGAELVRDNKPNAELLNGLRNGMDTSKVIFELSGTWIPGTLNTDVYQLKCFLIKTFGPDVNLANVMPDQIWETEALRCGLSVPGPPTLQSQYTRQEPTTMATALSQPNIRTEPLTGPMAWTAGTKIENGGVVTLDDACQQELRSIAEFLVKHPLPPLLTDREPFALDNCRAIAKQIRHQLEHGHGFVIIESLPIDYDYRVVTSLYWILMNLVGRPVAQKWNGEMIYDVTDTGKKATAGSGIRSSKTNGGQGYHTDNAFNLPPHFVGLLCLRPAKEGGESGLISFDSVYNKLLEKHPEVIPRLYQPFYFDRQREHAEGEPLYNHEPILAIENGVLHTRLATFLSRQGYVVAGQDIDDETEQALAALDDVLESDGMGMTFDFQPGQIQIVNNRRLGHRRTAYVDFDEPEKKRHLVRIWLRDDHTRAYLGH